MEDHTEGQPTVSKNRNIHLDNKRVSAWCLTLPTMCWMMNEQGGLSNKAPTPIDEVVSMCHVQKVGRKCVQQLGGWKFPNVHISLMQMLTVVLF